MVLNPSKFYAPIFSSSKERTYVKTRYGRPIRPVGACCRVAKKEPNNILAFIILLATQSKS